MLLTALVALAQPLWNGADMSFIPEYRDLGATFLDKGIQRDPLESFASRGANLLRLRVWVHPPKGYCTIDRTVALAKEAKAKGMRLLIDFHYSDDWADPQKQIPPAAWKDMDESGLAQAVYQHTRATLERLNKEGAPPEMVQIGNEIRNGTLWPVGDPRKSGYDPLARLLRAGIAATRSSSPKTQIMIHHDQGGKLKDCTAFFQALQQRGVRFDIIGLSYYPWWHGSLAELEATMNGLAAKFSKPVMIVETAYPFTLKWNDNTGNFVGEEKQLIPGYPASPEGQAKFLGELNRLVRAIPEGRGLGVVYWAPEYVAWKGIQTPCENLCLYDFEGKILPGADVLGDRD